jgi:hypothetical protein
MKRTLLGSLLLTLLVVFIVLNLINVIQSIYSKHYIRRCLETGNSLDYCEDRWQDKKLKTPLDKSRHLPKTIFRTQSSPVPDFPELS